MASPPRTPSAATTATFRSPHWAKRQVRGVKESPENNICCLSNRLSMFDSAIESLTRVDSNALFRF